MKRLATVMVCVAACKAPAPAAPPPSPAAVAPEPPASLEIRRDDLDLFAEQIIQAASQQDSEMLRALMDDEFISEPVGVTLDSDDVARTWAEHPALMNRLRRLLRGPCVFVDASDWLMCPAELTENLALYGDGGRAYLQSREDGWHWVGFWYDEEGPVPDGRRRGTLAESSLFVVPRYVPLAFREDEEFEDVEEDFEEAESKTPRMREVPRIQKTFTSDKDAIRFVVRRHLRDVRYCYDEGLGDDPELRGRVAIRFTIGPTGEVTRSEVAESEVPDDVADCIAKVIAFWRFPKPQGDKDVVVTYPFVLEPR